MSSPPATIELRASRGLCAALVVLAGAAGVAVGLSDAPWATLAVIPALLAMAWPAAPRWRALAFGSDGALRLIGPDTDARAEGLQRRGPLTVLALRAGGRVHRLVLVTPGTLRADERRRMSLWFERHAGRSQRQGIAAHV
jgi:hypothetical protein